MDISVLQVIMKYQTQTLKDKINTNKDTGSHLEMCSLILHGSDSFTFVSRVGAGILPLVDYSSFDLFGLAATVRRRVWVRRAPAMRGAEPGPVTGPEGLITFPRVNVLCDSLAQV